MSASTVVGPSYFDDPNALLRRSQIILNIVSIYRGLVVAHAAPVQALIERYLNTPPSVVWCEDLNATAPNAVWPYSFNTPMVIARVLRLNVIKNCRLSFKNLK